MMTADQIRERIAIALKATPGKWHAMTDEHWYGVVAIGVVAIGELRPGELWPDRIDRIVVRSDNDCDRDEDYEHIAANGPEAVVELCAELLAALAEIERLRGLVKDTEGCSGPCDSFGICSACTARAMVDHD